MVRTLEGAAELEVVRNLLHLRAAITDGPSADAIVGGDQAAEAARARFAEIVNDFFLDKLRGLPAIDEYMQAMAAES